MAPNSERVARMSNIVQMAANGATLIVACLLSIVLIKTYFLPGAPPQPIVGTTAQTTVSVGNNLKPQLPDVNWTANGETVLLALSTHCHFCTESTPFFRQLSEKPGRTFKIVAVLPESSAEAQTYLTREHVRVDQLKQMSLDKLGVIGTPTMLLLDKRGIVTKSWVGKLSQEEQGQALKAIS